MEGTTSLNRRLVWQSNLAMIAFVIVLFLLEFGTKTIFQRPGSIHQWRQADCLSITKNYYEEGMNFFEPKIHYQGPVDGKAVSECPILNYSVAALWKVFGEHEFIYRMLEYAIFLTAMFVFFNTLLQVSRRFLLPFIFTSFLMTSPLLAYYGMNFIADVPAFSTGLISLCLFLRFTRGGHRRNFYIALLLGTLAALMKASALIALSVLICTSLLDLAGLGARLGLPVLFKRRSVPLVFMSLSVLLIFAWYRFALIYNENMSNNIFLLTVLPIWKMEEADVIYNLKMLFNNHFPVFLNRPMLFLFLLMSMYVTARLRSLETVLRIAFIFSALFFAAYLVFFFQVFAVHDYYLNNLMIFPAVTFICMASLLTANGFAQRETRFLRIAAVCLIVFNSFHCAAIYRLRMVKDDKITYWFPFISEDERKLATYLFWDYSNSIGRIEEFSKELRSHGIKREDLTLVIPDPSFNISLYFLDQKGFGIAREHFKADPNVIATFMNRDLKYVVMSDTVLKTEMAFKNFEQCFEPFFSKGPVAVFKFHPLR